MAQNGKDDAKADPEKISKIPGVVTTVHQGGQTQVVIGNTVGEVYDAIGTLGVNLGGAVDEVVDEDGSGNGGSLLDRVMDLITNIIIPVLPAMIGGGMIKALLALCTTFFDLSTESGTYLLLYGVADAIFSYICVALAVTSARKFKMNESVAIALGIAMATANFIDGSFTFLGIPILGLARGTARRSSPSSPPSGWPPRSRSS